MEPYIKYVDKYLKFFGPLTPPPPRCCVWVEESVNNREKLTLKFLKSKDLSFQYMHSHFIIQKEMYAYSRPNTERSKVSAFFIEKYFYFIEIFDVILFTIEVHLIFCYCFFKKQMENYEKFHFMYVINRKKWKKISNVFLKFFHF